jgi:hypothetical protein
VAAKTHGQLADCDDWRRYRDWIQERGRLGEVGSAWAAASASGKSIAALVREAAAERAATIAAAERAERQASAASGR